MKRTVSLILILSLIVCCIIDSANAEDGLPFSGIHWGDTEESVHKKLGGRITHVGKTSALLDFKLDTGDMHSFYSLYFLNDRLYMIQIHSYVIGNEFFSDAYYSTMVQDYGEPIRTASVDTHSYPIIEDPEGSIYYWDIGGKTSIFMEPHSNQVSITYREIQEKSDEFADKPKMVFRGIPWGSDLPTVKEHVQETTFNTPSGDYAVTTSRRCINNGSSFGFGLGIYTSSQKRIDVAGYSATIVLGFAYTPNEDGLLSKNENDTALTYAEYVISHKDARFVVEDLKNKLTDVYGEPEHIQTNYAIEYDIYYWKGADGTIISLEGEFYDSGTTNVTIYYSFYGADDLYKQAQEAVNLEERMKTDKDDHTGL